MTRRRLLGPPPSAAGLPAVLPATMALVAVSIALLGAAQGPGPQRRVPFEEVATSTDVAFLEQLCVSFESTRQQALPGGLRGKAKTLRTVAYARLGELATPESLAAVRRIEALARQVELTPETVPMGEWTHPSWHFGDMQWREPAGITTLPDGRRYGIITSSMMGSVDLFLVWNDGDDPAAWSRPRLIPLPYYRGLRDPQLAPGKEGHLVLSYMQGPPPPRHIMEGTRELGKEAPELGAQSVELELAAITRDGDGDGWTDVEEERLLLDPNDPDSDGDGRLDGDDVTPDYAPAPEVLADERASIMAKAVFAAYGLSGSRFLLLVDDEQPGLDLWGYRGPVLYGVDRDTWTSRYEYGAVWVRWSIASMEGDQATVLVTDWEGMLAAGSQYVELRRIDGEWFVVGWRMGAVA